MAGLEGLWAGHHVQADVKFLQFTTVGNQNGKRYQYTAVREWQGAPTVWRGRVEEPTVLRGQPGCPAG
jgi:hypothetical protein